MDVDMDLRVIKIVLNHGQGQLWNASDVDYLRTQHRIIGCMIGSLPRHPHQSAMLGLPLQLMPEEVTLLLEMKFAKLVHYPDMVEMPTKPLVDKFKDLRQKCYEEQVIAAAKMRKKEIESVADKILKGRLKKLQEKNKSNLAENDSNFGLTRDKVIEMERKRIQKLPEQQQLIQIFTEHPMIDNLKACVANWSYPATDREKSRYNVFRSLWQEGHFITSGIKFGGDFLVYKGDPILFHASFIVKCVDDFENIDQCDLMTICRLANSTKKTVLVATHDGTEIKFKTFHLVDDR